MAQEARQLSIHAAVPVWITSDLHQPIDGSFAVVVYSGPKLEQVKGVPVRYRVLAGPLELADGVNEVNVETDSDGRAGVEARFTKRGAAIVAAEIANDPTQVVYFRATSDQRTSCLFLYCDQVVSAERGPLQVRVVALDHHDRPVLRAKIGIEASFGKHTDVVGKVREIGAGEYASTLRLASAGEWTVSAFDLRTKARKSRSLQVIPGGAMRLRFLEEPDPRAKEPYGEVLLRVQLEDSAGNPLDPHRVVCSVTGRKLTPEVLVGNEARFRVRKAGSGTVAVALADVSSKVRLNQKIWFAPTWMARPPLPRPGQQFRTPLYLCLPTNRVVRHATLNIEFNPRLANFVGLEQQTSGITGEVHLSKRQVRVEIDLPKSSQRLLPEPIYLGNLVWSCANAGRTCFNVNAKMSPSTPGWELCVDQKKEQVKCICLNLIYREGDAIALSQGRIALAVIQSILGSLGNVERCCPAVKTEIHECAISAANWGTTVVPAVGVAPDGTPAVTNRVEQLALFRTDLCQRTRCINFVMMRLAWADHRIGSTYMGPRSNEGFGVIDPAGVTADPNVAAHEAGHALGLDDAPADAPIDRLMHPSHMPSGPNITKEECQRIWGRVASYAC